MAGRLTICAAAAAAVLVAIPALASDRECIRSWRTGNPACLLSLDHEALDRRDRLSSTGGVAYLPNIEMIVVRVDADGKAAYACVDNAEAAKKFLEAPIEKIAREARDK